MTLGMLARKKGKIPFVCGVKLRHGGWMKVRIMEHTVRAEYPFRDENGYVYRASTKAIGAIDGGLALPKEKILKTIKKE